MHKSTKIKIAVAVLLVGMACMFTAVVTDHWAVLSPQVHRVNETCEAAHFGLWRLCKKHIYIHSAAYREGQSCGPISLPGGELDAELSATATAAAAASAWEPAVYLPAGIHRGLTGPVASKYRRSECRDTKPVI